MITYYSDRSDDFWPAGWMIWFCLIVGIFDVSIIGFIIHSFITHGV